MATLCIDTATEHGAVVVVRDDGAFASTRWRSKGRHGEDLFGHIDAALTEARATREELSLIGVNIGPGRFTSLRVGLGTAKGLAFALGLPIVGVSSLRVMARSIAADASAIRVPIMNAYRGDVFAAAYRIDRDIIEQIVPPSFGSPEEVFARISTESGRFVFGGEGVEAQAAVIESSFGIVLDQPQLGLRAPAPEAIAAEVDHRFRIEGPSDLDSLEPEYLRPSDAQLPKQPLKVETPG